MKEIARALIETQSVLIRPEEPFQLRSGRLSPIYVDCRRLISFPASRSAITQAFAEIAGKEIGRNAVDVVAGGETAGIPFAAFLAVELGKPMIYVRKAPKGYGKGAQIEGVLETGQRVLLVEDLVTDGGSKLVFQRGIETAGGIIKHCLCVFEYYSERAGLREARDRLKKHGIQLHSLTHWDELLELLRAEGRLTLEQHEQILTFLRDPEEYTRQRSFGEPGTTPTRPVPKRKQSSPDS
ncbi:MAG: orotate phosphoribosyltransferase [Candidatus Fraserbacteria bacterium RBG_16_55_9]|uniref:Orotate phosphoribosyltransferase n=1 Tax=Fraserbacteria sp. (strain RBG_16_55_9) TaxID=1817864 RepID=A0A1F5UQ96_FRAXR|nr:MAG: orotate phosphoribosyltransferase [Candidatus Fraserbacteria bacterium RBG_16_55_9]